MKPPFYMRESIFVLALFCVTCRAQTIMCTSAPSIANGTATGCAGSTAIGGTCALVCDSGFLMTGAAISTCEDGGIGDEGIWNIGNSSCEAIMCTSSPSIGNGSATDCASSVVIDGTCALLCDSGFSMTGVAVATCTDTGDGDLEGTWDIGTSSCEVILCTSSPSIANGEATNCAGSAFIGGACALLCYSGFSMTGAAVATCTDDGDGDIEATWDIGNSSCEVVLCTSSPSIANGEATNCAGSAFIGGTCALLCYSGFSMTGAAVATCTDDGDGDVEGIWNIGNFSCEADATLPEPDEFTTAVGGRTSTVQPGSTTITTGTESLTMSTTTSTNEGFALPADYIYPIAVGLSALFCYGV